MARAVRSPSFPGSYGRDAPASQTRIASASRRAGIDAGWTPLATLAADPAPWRDLVRRALEPNVFLEPAFARAAAAHLGGGEVGAVVVRARGRLVGLLPGRVESMGAGRPVATFVAWTHPFAPLSTPLVDRDAAADVVAATLDYLPRLRGAPRLALFPLLAEEGPVARLMAAHIGRAGRAPCRLGAHRRAALMPEEATPISSKKLKELRRQRRRLAEEGVLTRETAIDADAMRAAVADYLDVEAKGWKRRAGSAVKLDPSAARFLTEAVSALAREGKVRIDLLKLDGRAIAATITLFSGDRAWFWKTGYDEAFARFSPGVQLALDLTEALAGDRSLALVDSCAGADHPMIDHLWGGRLAIADWLVPLDGQAAFAVGVAAERVRRALIAPLRMLRDRLRR